MKQVLLVYGILKETLTAIMMLNKNTKVMVSSLDSNIELCDIVTANSIGNT